MTGPDPTAEPSPPGAPRVEPPPQVVVSVGTDHHRFDRLIDWIDSWTDLHPEVPVLVQRGTSRPPRRARSAEMLGRPELVAAMAGARAVVVQGGPAGIADSRRAGVRPIVVARRPELGEHVDGHQVTFTRWIAERSLVCLAEDAGTLHRLLDDSLANPDSWRVSETTTVPAAVAAFAAQVDPLLTPGRGTRKRLRRH